MTKKEKCFICGSVFVSDGISTGYGIDDKDNKVCFVCCGKADEKYLQENGKLSGYFDGVHFTNWPGTFKLAARNIRKSWHNFAGKNGRTDYDVYYNNIRYHGVFIGFNHQCSTIKACKN